MPITKNRAVRNSSGDSGACAAWFWSGYSLYFFLTSITLVTHQVDYVSSVEYSRKMIDRQVGRNAELFADAIAAMEKPEERYPYLRILVSIIEQAHPEWNQAPRKDRQIAHLVGQMADNLNADEVADVVRVRDEERGYFYD
jgi:hypothetical protein